MARGHLFLIVVLLGAAAIAGLLAVTRTAAQPASSASPDSAIAFRMKKLDRLEASLAQRLAQQAKAAPSPAPTVVYRRATSTTSVPRAGDDHGDAYKHEGGHEQGRDD
jgi:hypothetical protein